MTSDKLKNSVTTGLRLREDNESKMVIRKVSFILFLINILMAANIDAACFTDADPSDNFWSSDANWDVTPVDGDNVFIGEEYVVQGGEAHAVLDFNTPGYHSIRTGRIDYGEIDVISDGELNFNVLYLGVTASGQGYLTLEGGIVNAGTMNIGWDGYAECVIDIGRINADIIRVPGRDGSGVVKFNDGQVHTTELEMSENGLIKIGKGLLVLDGDQVSTVNEYIDNGWITASEPNSSIYVNYNQLFSGKTVVSTQSQGWASFRHDKNLSSCTKEHLELPLNKAWTYIHNKLPDTAWPESGSHRNRRHQNRVFQTTGIDDNIYFASPLDNTVYAINTESGQHSWTYIADGPVRFAPTIWKNKAYFGSDDGYVYCVDAQNGNLLWRKWAGPLQKRRLLGNGSMMSLWPVRTNVLVDNGVAYFASGIFPYEGIYVWAIDATDGQLLWRNDVRNSTPQIGGASFSSNTIGGRSPHGYLAANEQYIFVPSGRGMPMVFERDTGLFKFETGYTRTGGTWMLLLEDILLAGTSDSRARDTKQAYSLETGQMVSHEFPECLYVIASESTGYSLTRTGIKATDRSSGTSKWNYSNDQLCSLILADQTVFAGGEDFVVAVDCQTGQEQWRADVNGQAYGLAVIKNRLIVSTTAGEISCFQYDDTNSTDINPSVVSNPYPDDELSSVYESAANYIVEVTDVNRGWALVLDAGTGRLAYELANETDLNIVGIEDDIEKRQIARTKLRQTGLYGNRIVITGWDIQTLPDYFANIIISDDMLVTGNTQGSFEDAFRVLKPYGGIALLGGNEQINPEQFQQWMTLPDHNAPEILNTDPVWCRFTRRQLKGAGSWRQLYADKHNRGVSHDEQRVRGPLGILWFGEPGEQGLIDRHGRPMSPVGINGRMFIQGENKVLAYDAYNGTLLWETEMPGAYRCRVDVDSGNLALTEDSLYVAAYDKCYRIDCASGNITQTYTTPSTTEKPHRWGYISVVGDKLIGTTASPSRHDYAVLWNEWVDEPDNRWRDDSEVPVEIRNSESASHRWWNAGRDGETMPDPIPTSPLKNLVNFFRSTYPEPFGKGSLAYRAMHKSFKLFEPIGYYPPWDPLKSLDFQAVTPYLETVSANSIFALDVNTGQTLWQQDGELIPNIAVVIGDDKLYYMEKCQSQTDFDQALQNRDALISNGVYEPSTEENIDPNFIDVRHIVALDLEGGQVVWDKHVDITGCGGEKAGLIWQNDVLLIAGHFQLKDLNSWYKDGGLQWRRITSFNGDNSEILWSKPLNYSHRPPIIDNKIIAEPRAVDIQSGEFIDRRNPITGKYQHFFVDRMGKNCAPMQGSRHMLFFRRQDIEMFDFENDIGITRVGSVRPSCWINMIAANGLALFPEGASGCSCPYPIKTSFAMKQVDHDQYSAWAAYPQRGPLLPVDNLCINFGAPGDRKDKQGKLWLGYPRPGVVENELSFDLSENVLAGMGVYGQDYRFKQFCNTDRPWLFGAGIIGIENLTIPLTEGEQARFTVRIGFTALPSDSEGSRVFNLKFGQDTVLLNFDLFSEAGGADHIIVKEFQQVPVTGDLAVEFIPVADDPDIAQAPLVNFIEIEREYLADINKDKNVDFLDFSLLLQHWHNTDCNNVNNWCDNTDFNEDGFINVFDLEILTNNWLNR